MPYAKKHSESILLLLLAAVLVTLFSTCSPLYPINPWDDANVFMTVGKSMLRGRVLYRDIFDQKGPMLFFLHELAAAISYTSFLGVYLMEVLGLWCFATFSLRTMRLFSSSRLVVPLLCLTLLLTVTSDAFFYGDSAEEFCLPLLAHALFHMLRLAKEGVPPRRHESLLMGVGAGIVFWTKFNIFVFFYGASLLALAFIAWRKGTFRALGRTTAWAVLGIAVVSLGVFSYFVGHHAVRDLIDTYFLTNLFKYNGVSSNGEPAFWWFVLVKIAIMCVLLLPVLLPRTGWEVKLLVASSYGALLLSFTFLTVQFYYFLLLYLYAPLSLVYVRHLTPGARLYGLMLAVAALAAALNWNLVTLVRGTFSHLTLDITEIVNSDHSADSKVMNFVSYDTGIYLKSRHLPPCKYFFINNIEDEGIRRELHALARSGRMKYLAREIVPIHTSHDYYDMPAPPGYQLVYDGREDFRYRFYTRPHMYLWNLGYLRPLLRIFMNPATEPRRMLLYKRTTKPPAPQAVASPQKK